MDTLLIGKIIYEACRARDNGHRVEGGRPDWFHLPDGAKANMKNDAKHGESDDGLAQAIMDYYGCKATVTTVTSAPVLAAAPRKKPVAKKPTKRKAKR